MKEIISRADKVNTLEGIVQIHFSPWKLSKIAEAFLKEELDIDATVYHDFRDLEQYNNYYLIVMGSDFEDNEVAELENFLSAQIDNEYAVTLSIIDRLFEGRSTRSYVKFAESIDYDSRVYDMMIYKDVTIVIEFTQENYDNFLEKN